MRVALNFYTYTHHHLRACAYKFLMLPVWVVLWLALVGDSPQEPSVLLGITENEAEHIRSHIHPVDAKGTKVSVVFVCVCMIIISP